MVGQVRAHLKQVGRFKYLSGCEDDGVRVKVAWKKWSEMLGMCDKIMTIELKAKAYKTVARPEYIVWLRNMRKPDQQLIEKMEMLRWMLGVSRWRE